MNEFFKITLELTKKMSICIENIRNDIDIDVEKINWQMNCQN